MQSRSASKIAGLMTALILLLAALIVQVYAAYDFKFEEVTAENDWEFSWQTESYENYAWIQFKGGGVTSVWTSISNESYSRENNRTHVKFAALVSDPSGLTFDFRARVQYCVAHNELGDCDQQAKTGWSTVEVKFD